MAHTNSQTITECEGVAQEGTKAKERKLCLESPFVREVQLCASKVDRGNDMFDESCQALMQSSAIGVIVTTMLGDDDLTSRNPYPSTEVILWSLYHGQVTFAQATVTKGHRLNITV